MKIGKKHELIYREIEEGAESTATETEGEKEDDEVKSKKKGLVGKIALGVAATGGAIAAGVTAYKKYKEHKDSDDGYISVTTDDPGVAGEILKAAFGDSDDSKEEQTEDEDN